MGSIIFEMMDGMEHILSPSAGRAGIAPSKKCSKSISPTTTQPRIQQARPLSQANSRHSQIAPLFSQSRHQNHHLTINHTQTGNFAASAHKAHCRPCLSGCLRCHRNADVSPRVCDRALRRGRRGMDEQVRDDEVAGNYTRERGISG